MATMGDTTQTRRFHPTGRFVLALLAVEVLLWLSDRFGWFGWHKGLSQLEELDLKDTKFTDEGVKKLRQALPNCKIEL